MPDSLLSSGPNAGIRPSWITAPVTARTGVTPPPPPAPPLPGRHRDDLGLTPQPVRIVAAE